MERLTIDEIIEHCKRRVDHAEQFYGKGRFESVDMSHRIDKEYWEHRQVAEYLEELKEYRKAEEQGLLLRLPCKLGDTVWLVGENFMLDYEVRRILVSECGIEAVQVAKEVEGVDRWNCLYVEDIGKTVFLTREEAESALAEKGGAE